MTRRHLPTGADTRDICALSRAEVSVMNRAIRVRDCEHELVCWSCALNVAAPRLFAFPVQDRRAGAVGHLDDDGDAHLARDSGALTGQRR